MEATAVFSSRAAPVSDPEVRGWARLLVYIESFSPFRRSEEEQEPLPVRPAAAPATPPAAVPAPARPGVSAAVQGELRIFGETGEWWPPLFLEPTGPRAETLQLLDEVLASPGSSSACLHGPSGIGKSTLLLHALQRIHDRGQGLPPVVWHNCSRHADRALSLRATMTDLLLQAHPELADRTKEGPFGRELPVDAVAAAGDILVLDNAERLLGDDGALGEDEWLRSLVARAANRAGGNLKLVLVSWHHPRPIDGHCADPLLSIPLDTVMPLEQMRRLLEVVDHRTTEGRALAATGPAEREALLNACCGNPAALNAALSSLRLRLYESVADLVSGAFLDALAEETGRATRLQLFYEDVVRRCADHPRRWAALVALAMLGRPFPLDGEDVESEAVARVAGAVLRWAGERPATVRQLRLELDRFTSGLVPRDRHERTERTLYSLAPHFAWTVRRRLLELPPEQLAVLAAETAAAYQSLMGALAEQVRSSAAHVMGGNRVGGYVLESPEYRDRVTSWIRALLANPRRDRHAAAAGIARVLMELHWWWAVLVRWEVFDQVLAAIERELRIEQALSPDFDFSIESGMIPPIRRFVEHFPLESRWWETPDLASLKEAAAALQTLRSRLGIDGFVGEAAEEPGGDIRGVAAITDEYLGDLAQYELALPSGAGERREELLKRVERARISARSRFLPREGLGDEEAGKEDLSWSVLYVVADQCRLAALRADEAALRKHAREGLALCRASDELLAHELGIAGQDTPDEDAETQEHDAAARLYWALAEGLAPADPDLALQAAAAAHWEAFCYLWHPATVPPNDDYTLTHYEMTCDRTAFLAREIYARGAAEAGKAVAWCGKLRAFWSSAGEERLRPPAGAEPDWSSLLAGWAPGDAASFGVPGSAPKQAAARLRAALFPSAPAAYDDADYVDRAGQATLKLAPRAWEWRDALLRWAGPARRRRTAETPDGR